MAATKQPLRMTYRDQKLRALTVEEFDAVRLFMISNVRIMMEVTPQDEGESRRDYIDRIQRKVLLLQDRPQLIVDLQAGGYDFVLAKLGNPDASEASIALERQMLEEMHSGTLDPRTAHARIAKAENPAKFEQMQRAMLEQRLNADKQRRLLLNRH